MSRSDQQSPATELAHVVVVGGSLAEWATFDAANWDLRLATVARGVESSGARWVTLLPRDGEHDLASAVAAVLSAVDRLSTVEGSEWRWIRTSDAVSVIVDLEADGRRRFATAVEALRERSGGAALVDTLSEERLAAEVLRPATFEPDLVVILGPPDRLPRSLMWELAYSELVFLDIDWDALDSSHLEMAVEDFHRRHRRFGGLDS